VSRLWEKFLSITERLADERFYPAYSLKEFRFPLRGSVDLLRRTIGKLNNFFFLISTYYVLVRNQAELRTFQGELSRFPIQYVSLPTAEVEGTLVWEVETSISALEF